MRLRVHMPAGERRIEPAAQTERKQPQAKRFQPLSIAEQQIAAHRAAERAKWQQSRNGSRSGLSLVGQPRTKRFRMFAT